MIPVMGVAEAAAYLKITKQTLSNMVTRGSFPPPAAQLACGPVWYTEVVMAYKTVADGEFKALHAYREAGRKLNAAKQRRRNLLEALVDKDLDDMEQP